MRSVLLVVWAFIVLGIAGCTTHERPAKSQRLEPISVAPDFAAKDETGKTRTLSEFRGRAVVLYFYPKDGTPGCTREACAFRDEWERLKASGAQVVGVSIDSVESHAAFKREHSLPFPLLSDPDGRVLAQYGVPRMPQGYASRTTFIVDAQGIIRRIFPEVDPAVHVKEVLATLQQLSREGLDRPSTGSTKSDKLGVCEAKSKQEPSMTNANEPGTWAYLMEPKRPEMVNSPSAEEQATVEAHFKYLKELTDRGVVLMAGRSNEPPYFGIVVFRAPDRAGAQALLDGDPAVKAGVFKGRLQEFRVPLMAGQK